MSATEVVLDEEYTEVLSPRKGLLQSALFHHLHRTECNCFASVIAARKIKEVIPPTETRHAYILELDPAILTHDIFALLPADVKSNYTLGANDVHIRIDREFYGKDGSSHDQLRQWHLSFRIAVGNKQCITIHVFCNYNRWLAVWIKEPNKLPYQPDDIIDSRAKANAEKAYKIVKLAVDEMKLQMLALNAEFKEKLQQLSNISYLRAISEADLERALAEASTLNDQLAAYNEAVIDRRFSFILAFVQQWRKKDKLPAITMERPTPLSLEDSDSIKHEGQGITRSRARSRSSTKSFSPTSDMEKINIDDLRVLLNTLRATAEKPFTTAKAALDFDAKVRKLKLDLTVAYVDAKDEKTERMCIVIEAAVATLPGLIDAFYAFASDLNPEAVKELFAVVQAEIPENFYMRFLFSVTQFMLSPEEQQNAIVICELFFSQSQGYRMFVSCLDDMTMEFKAFDGKEIRTSMLLHVAIKRYFGLFKLLIKQSGAINYHGYVQDRHGISLLKVLCALSKDENSDAFINELLARKPLLQTPYPFANGIKIIGLFDSENPIVSLVSSGLMPDEQAREDANRSNALVEMFTGVIGDIPYIGSALSAYCSSRYQDQEILCKLAAASSTLHLILGFGHFCFDGIGSVSVFANEKFGIRTESNSDRRIQLALTQSRLCATTGVRYLGCILGQSINPRAHTKLEAFVRIVKSRLAATSSAELHELIEQLHTSLEVYRASKQTKSALACTKAILFLSMFLEPSAEVHNLIVKFFILAGDLHDQDLDHKIILENDRVPERNVHYLLAQKFVFTSMHRKSLANNPDIARITAMVDYRERIVASSGNPTVKLR